MKKPLSIYFPHGVGDCVHFSHMLPLWLKRGYAIEVHTCEGERNVLFEAAGAFTCSGAQRTHPYWEPVPIRNAFPPELQVMGQDWRGNKAGQNLCSNPLPRIGSQAELWSELLNVQVDLLAMVSQEQRIDAAAFVQRLPRPLILLHTRGHTSKDRKDFTSVLELELYHELTQRIGGTLLQLDTGNETARSPLVRSVLDWRRPSLLELLALLECADLLIGCDSGPLHFSRFSSVKALGVWFKTHPAQLAIPRANSWHLTPPHAWNEYRQAFQLIEAEPTAVAIAENAARLLA